VFTTSAAKKVNFRLHASYAPTVDGAPQFFLERCDLDDDQIIGHLKAHV
jgi:hypothetical protein